MNIRTICVIGFSVQNSDFGKSLLPNRRMEAQFSSGAKRKSAFDQLQGSFDGHIRIESNQNVEVIRHDNKLMHEVLQIISVMEQHINE